MRWFLRSVADHDTHAVEGGSDGVVVALCGAAFEPLPLPTGDIALPGRPVDPQQICAHCERVIHSKSRRR
jgi:hypothetical protein